MKGVTKEFVLTEAHPELADSSPVSNLNDTTDSTGLVVPNRTNSISLAELHSSTLLVVPILIGGVATVALIDSGATVSLVSSDLIDKLKSYSSINDSREVGGLGDKKIQSSLAIKAPLELHGISLYDTTAYVVPADEIRHPVILGINCLLDNSMTLDMTKNRISGPLIKGGSYDFYLGKDNNSCQIIFTQVPVLASEKCTISKDEPVTVKVETDSCLAASCCQYCNICCGGSISDVEYFYDGNISSSSSKYLVGYAGYCDSQLSEVILTKTIGIYPTKGKVNVGDKLGCIDSVVTLDKVINNKDIEVNVASSTDEWTLDKLKASIKLCPELTSAERDDVYNMLYKRTGVMSVGNDDVGFAAVTSHKIKLYDTTPIRIKPRHFPAPTAKLIEDECQRLLDLDIIEHSKSPFSAPVCPVIKPDRSLRLCLDYRELNKVTIADRFPIPSLRDCIFSLYNRKYFTSLDLTSGFHQIPLDESSREYTAFSTQHNHYQFKRLSFGLKNCPSAFQRELQTVLQDFGSNVIIYIDDILILSNSLTDHIDLVESLTYFGVSWN